VEVTIYGALNAPFGAILGFLDRLEYVPTQHDPRWAHVFRRLPRDDFYIALASENDRIFGITSYTVFAGPMGTIAHANPYMGYGGCSCVPGTEDEVVPALIREVTNHVRTADCVTLSLAIPPFQEHMSDLYHRSLEADYCFSNFFQYNDLDLHPLERMNSVCRHRIVNKLRRTSSLGVTARPAVAASEVEAWLDIYNSRCEQLAIRPLPREFLMEAWRHFASVGKAQLFLAWQDTQLLGGGLFVEGRGIVDYFSCAYNDQGMELYANMQVVDTAIKYYRAKGIKRLNWQSSPSRESGVYTFKKRWGAVEGQYMILTKILGDPRVFTGKPLAEVREAYGHHFVLPHPLWDGHEQMHSSELKPSTVSMIPHSSR
jgi:hypothetical protein